MIRAHVRRNADLVMVELLMGDDPEHLELAGHLRVWGKAGDELREKLEWMDAEIVEET